MDCIWGGLMKAGLMDTRNGKLIFLGEHDKDKITLSMESETVLIAIDADKELRNI